MENKEDLCEKCKKVEYDVGITGFEYGEVIHRKYCTKCYNKIFNPRKKLKKEEEND